MKIRRFVADSFQEAMNQAKMEMGRDAIILHSRRFKEGGVLGLFAKQRFEITVAVDEDTRTRFDSIRPPELEPPKEAVKISKTPKNTQKARLSVEAKPDEFVVSNAVLEEIRTMKEMVEDIRERVGDKQKPGPQSKRGQSLLKLLTSNQVDEKVAVKVIKLIEERMQTERYNDSMSARELEKQVVADLLKKARPIEFKGKKARTIALVGPTGVGKTTTIAKLAANFSLIDKRKVALVTMDTYRIAAVDQLKTYAEIIGVPLEVVFNPDGLKSSLKKLASNDIIFIDTAGRSPKNEEHMQELADFLEVAKPDEVILVLSAATRTEDLLEAYKRFKVNRVDKIIFTKLDETNCYGQILSVVYRTKSHISYITNGQNVPDDIEVPNELQLAAMILGEEGTL